MSQPKSFCSMHEKCGSLLPSSVKVLGRHFQYLKKFGAVSKRNGKLDLKQGCKQYWRQYHISRDAVRPAMFRFNLGTVSTNIKSNVAFTGNEQIALYFRVL